MDNIRAVEPQTTRKERGQALVEYALILAFVVITFAVMLALTGPAIGNIFSNVVYNLIGQNPQDVVSLATQGNPTQFWLTVTWVAQNPQGETPYPTPLNLPTDDAPTQFVPFTPSNTPTASNTQTPTSTRTPTPTRTTTATYTAGPSPTPGDKEFLVPFADRADEVFNWRLDRAYVLNPAGWNVEYNNGTSCTGALVTGTSNWINFDWAGGSPDVLINSDNFIACWQNTFTLAQDTLLKFSAENLAGGTMRVELDGSTTVLNANSTGDSNSSTILAGPHSMSVTYTHTNGNAAVALLVERPSQNPSDTLATGVDGCPWATTASNLLSGSPMNVFDDNPATNSWPTGQTCYLELRGWINSASAANPRLSFWDVWDFASAAGIVAELQIVNYQESSPGVLDRTVWNTPLATFTNLHSPGTANYNWTRREIDLGAIAGLSNRWTFRFVLGNTSGSTQTLRWYIDDVQVLANPTPNNTFTVNNGWNLNTRSQMADFIFNADASYTLEQSSAAPPSSEWRWNIASDHARSGTAFVLKDYAPSAATSGGAGSERIYYSELRYPVDMTAGRVPQVPVTDFDGDAGPPLLSFWHAYQLATGASIRVEYYNTSLGAWAVVPDSPPSAYIDEGMLLNFNTFGGGRNEASVRTALSMQPISIRLSEIPNWDIQPFRLRFALVINQAASVAAGDGWFIDDVKVERDIASPYMPFPFHDSAESSTDSANFWVGTGAWARTSQGGGVLGGGYNYSDTPGTSVNYTVGVDTWLETRRMIDLLYDTVPENPEVPYTAASRPMLNFWMRRDLQGYFDVEIWTRHSNTWTTAWRMDNSMLRSTNTAWEHVEVDLRTAVAANTGRTWGQINSADGNLYDDDIKIRFHLLGTGSAGYDGISVDEIGIVEYSEQVHRLWDGDPEYVDSIESNSDGLALDEAWYLGGLWGTHSGQGFGGTLALSDSPGFATDENWLAMAQMRPIFDLTNMPAGRFPALDFRIRYNIANLDQLRVQIAEEQTIDTGPQVYDDILGWSAWSDLPLTLASGGTLVNGRVDTLVLGRVNLSPHVGRRIRLRFVLDTVGDLTYTDGLTIDNIALTYHDEAVIPAPWSDWTNLSNWTYEGSWGSTEEFFTGGTVGGDLGSNGWYGLFFDCETLADPALCNSQPVYTTIMQTYTDDPITSPCPPPTAGIVCQNPQPVPDLNLWLLDGQKPNGVGDEYIDTFAARWVRVVDLAPTTTYRVYSISNEGMRLSIDNPTGITGVTSPGNYLINAWFPHSNQLDVHTFQTGSGTFTGRELTVEFFDIGWDGVMSLSISTSRFSFSDSPNTQTGVGYSEVLSSLWGNSSLMYNGFISTPSSGVTTLQYQVMWDLAALNTFHVDVSYDGGFTWGTADTLPGLLPLDIHPPAASWLPRSISLIANEPNVTFRFRLNTTANGDNNNQDGVWLSDISISTP